jgi:hypothetical protein
MLDTHYICAIQHHLNSARRHSQWKWPCSLNTPSTLGRTLQTWGHYPLTHLVEDSTAAPIERLTFVNVKCLGLWDAL